LYLILSEIEGTIYFSKKPNQEEFTKFWSGASAIVSTLTETAALLTSSLKIAVLVSNHSTPKGIGKSVKLVSTLILPLCIKEASKISKSIPCCCSKYPAERPPAPAPIISALPENLIATSSILLQNSNDAFSGKPVPSIP
jgi:hypothetical protein